MPINKYLGAARSADASEFERALSHASVDRSVYIDALVNQRDNVEEIYKAYWHHPENMERARRITPRLDGGAAAAREKIVNMLKPYLRTYSPAVKAWTVPQQAIPQLPCDLSDVEHYAKLMRVRFVQRWYLGSTWLQFMNWWYGLGIRRFSIIDGDTQNAVGDMYLVEGKIAQTLPLASKGCVLVTTPNDFNLIHESVHAVQFSFEDFWNIPRTDVEIPAMFLENVARRDKQASLSEKHIARQAALAIADLTTESPDDFNAVYEELMGITEAGHIRARMPQLVNCPHQYYGYVLGLTCPFLNIPKLGDAVRDSAKIMDRVV